MKINKKWFNERMDVTINNFLEADDMQYTCIILANAFNWGGFSKESLFIIDKYKEYIACHLEDNLLSLYKDDTTRGENECAKAYRYLLLTSFRDEMLASEYLK